MSVSYYSARGNADWTEHPPYYVAESKVRPWIAPEAARLSVPDRVQVETGTSGDRDRLNARRERVLDHNDSGDIDKKPQPSAPETAADLQAAATQDPTG
jgi:hypothetical protein